MVHQSNEHFRRRRIIMLTTVISVTFGGFIYGVRPQRAPQMGESGPAVTGIEARQREARSHERLRADPWRPGQQAWSPTKVAASPQAADSTKRKPKSAAEREAGRALRRDLRAFEGAPPMVPHPVNGTTDAACVVCHADGMAMGDRTAFAYSHGLLSSCQQCHVAAAGPFVGAPQRPQISLASRFEGAFDERAPMRAMPGAPPQIPHAVFMRQRCSSCHGVHGRSGLETSHPERQSCTQCHAAAADVVQRGGP